jgi:hypothetical protein
MMIGTEIQELTADDLNAVVGGSGNGCGCGNGSESDSPGGVTISSTTIEHAETGGLLGIGFGIGVAILALI